jgi:hypothetical protein
MLPSQHDTITRDPVQAPRRVMRRAEPQRTPAVPRGLAERMGEERGAILDDAPSRAPDPKAEVLVDAVDEEVLTERSCFVERGAPHEHPGGDHDREIGDLGA